MKKVMRLLSPYKKWLWILPYLVAILLAWQRRYTAYQYIPALFRRTLLGDLLPDIVFLALAFTGLVCLVQLLRYPLYQKRRFQRAFERIGLHNAMGEYPVLLSKRADKQQQYGTIYKLKNMGISIADFDNRNAQLEAALGLKVYRIEYGRKAQKILLYAIPRKHVKPTIISLGNEAVTKEFRKLPNLLCIGKTGSGKSYALLLLLGIYATIPDVSITICDYKKSSFAQFENTPNFYGFNNVPDGIRAFYQEFSERLGANDEERNKHIRVLLIDEYGTLISSKDKKAADELKAMVANMLFMSRSLGLKILIGVQRADAEYFKAGARDQFHAILGLGELSRESINMNFSEFREKMNEHCGVGEGYLLIDGQDIERVKVAPITDFVKLNESIRKAMYH